MALCQTYNDWLRDWCSADPKRLKGVALVRYGAEREAEIQQILASDPDALEELTEEDLGLAKGYFQSIADLFARLRLE